MSLPSRGSIQDEPLPILLAQLQRAQATGVVHLEARSGRHAIYLREGFPVSVELPGSAEMIGRVLVEMGVIDEATHKRSLASPPPKGARYGEVLVEQGLVSLDQLRLALKAQVRRKLHRLFFLEDAQFAFTPGEHGRGVEHDQSLKVHPARAIYQGVRSAWDAQRLAGALFLLEGRAIRCQLDEQSLARYGVSRDEARVAALLREGFWLLPELVATSGLPAQPVHALVYALYITD
jgi:hypothetical protein